MNKNRGYYLENGILVINRDLTELDLFLRDFLNILKKNSDYLVVSGFISISTGRTRGTEDIDVLVPVLNKENFSELFKSLQEKGFWCYQGDTIEEVYPYVEEKKNIRFARLNELFPNIEFIPIDKSRKAKYFEFKHFQKMKIKGFEFKIPPIEFAILYKEIILRGEKNLADAKHLRVFFSEILKKENFKEYENIIKEELK